ncbi:hypothetical protein BJ878DRAFT_538079 [Calycina marina]|uniref:DUF7905 domain-containing protein n=1 Tax=Calycina marina TaxID=1763456 RepID=A0A9P7ZB68_9HELO|nr:hypothetical protein BJ878DRAFT_538079 [Calycina marina]
MVKFVEDFESVNARDWESESTISDSSEFGVQSRRASPAIVTTGATIAGPHAPAPPRDISIRPAPVFPRFQAGPAPSVTTDTTNPPPYRALLLGRTGKTGWSKGPVLEKTRERLNKEKRQVEAARENKYLGQPDVQGEMSGTGFYIWPKNIDKSEAGSNHPRDLFGANLEGLDLLRKEYHVYIIWDEQSKCIKVMSTSVKYAQYTIALAIKGIRNEVRNANAREQHAIPLYIVVPPSGIMQWHVAIKSEKKNSENSAGAVITGFKLDGPTLSREEQQAWDVKLPELHGHNLKIFEDHISIHTTRLAPIRKWMRMRVHFGNVHLHKYKEEVRKTGFKFSQFEKTMTDSRTTRIFDRRMESAVAKKFMKNIVALPGMFCPKESKFFNLEKVMPKHTLVMFFELGNQNVRVEATLEQSNPYEMPSGWGTSGEVRVAYTGGYQVGTTMSFYNSGRSKRAEVTTIDVQKGSDWTFEIIEDDTFPQTPSSLISLIKGCVTDMTQDRKDSIGLGYPAIDFKGKEVSLDVPVSSLVMKSVYEYIFAESQYIIEVAVYRSWDVTTKIVHPVRNKTSKFEGTRIWDYKRTEPEVQTSVSMYHSVWDWETASIEHETSERGWDKELKCFFREKYQVGGMKRFMEEIAFVQTMLVDAQREDSGVELTVLPKPNARVSLFSPEIA